MQKSDPCRTTVAVDLRTRVVAFDPEYDSRTSDRDTASAARERNHIGSSRMRRRRSGDIDDSDQSAAYSPARAITCG